MFWGAGKEEEERDGDKHSEYAFDYGMLAGV